MRLEIIESPYAGDVKNNLKYARACLRDSLMKGASPYASHLLLTQEGVLDDNVPIERTMGISAGFAFKPFCVTIFYIDLGFSSGMLQTLSYCDDEDIPYELRRLDQCQLDKLKLPKKLLMSSNPLNQRAMMNNLMKAKPHLKIPLTNLLRNRNENEK